MIFENLTIGRVAVHEVYQRNEDRSIRPPAFADQLENLGPEALTAFRLRMTDALSGQSQSLQMRIVKHDAGSFLSAAESIIGASAADFLSGSKGVANKLAEAQLARRIPGGMLIVFDGTMGAPAAPFVGVIKAETKAGFRRSLKDDRAVIEFLQNIFLTPATRLYKIGVLVQVNTSAAKPDGWKAFVFDSNISLSNRESAAAYFYESFLGCALPSDGAYETARFFDLTKEFVRKTDLDVEKRRDIIDSLYVFVRDEQPHIFEMVKENYIARPLGDWQARGLVHFDYDGPLIPFEMSVGSLRIEDGSLGHFHWERIQPYNSPDYPEEHKGSYLRVGIHILDRGGICDHLEKAMHDAAISGKNFLHIRLGKPVVDIEVTRKEIAENNYSSSSPITKVVLTDEIRLKSPGVALAWDNL